MRNATIFIALAATVLAAPGQELSTKGNGILAQNDLGSQRIQIQKTLKALDLLGYQTRDWISDIIRAILGVSVAELLSSINSSLEQLRNLITNGVAQLNDLMKRLDTNTQQQIQNIINQALKEALTIITPILSDLGLILPSITKATISVQGNAADLIYAILGISLEDFLIKITTALEQSFDLLSRTMRELSTIASKIQDPNIAGDLHNISNDYLERGQAVIRPVLNSLYQVLPSRSNPVGLVADIVSESMGLQVVTTANVLDTMLQELEVILTKFVTRVNRILDNPDGEKVSIEVNRIVKTSVQDAEAVIQPILEVLFQFLPTINRTSLNSGTGNNHKESIITTILGISLEDFLNYVDYAAERVQEIYTKTEVDLKHATKELNPSTCSRIRDLIESVKRKIAEASEPFLLITAPIYGERKWISTEEFMQISKPEDRGKVFCNFSLRSGYNKDFIIHLISRIFNFDVIEAARELSVALVGLDTLYLQASVDLNELLANDRQFVINEVNRIVNISVNATHDAIQPILDILMEFVPSQGRQDRDVISGIIRAISSLKFENFKKYMHFSTQRLISIRQNAVSNIRFIVSYGKRTKSDSSEKVDRVIVKTLESTEKILEPFLQSIGPIFESV